MEGHRPTDAAPSDYVDAPGEGAPRAVAGDREHRDARSLPAPGHIGAATPEERVAENLRRAVESFERHAERCRWCRAAQNPNPERTRRCELGADLWRVVLHRSHPARLQEERGNG
jgi:hypothetical protein